MRQSEKACENERNRIVLVSTIEEDEKTDAIKGKFDYLFNGQVQTTIIVPDFPEDFQIGLIVGSSGSGKSTILSQVFGEMEEVKWDNNKAIISNFETAEDGVNRLSAVGLSSIPSWCKPYNVLSTGEKFRADMARRIKDNAVVDEFTSVVNREAAKSCSFSVQKYIRKNNIRRVVFATCHEDVEEYLLPDWVYNTDTQELYIGRYLQRPPIELVFERCSTKEWGMFEKHHYLNGSINPSSKCVIVKVNDTPVAFSASLAFPFKGCTNAFRESRLVVLPDYQGIGIGNTVSETIAQMYVDRGFRYFSKTTNPRCGIHRDKSPLWRPTSHNHKKRKDYIKDGHARVKSKYAMSEEMQMIHANRICYSHEYVGERKETK